jgi:hypothetical protein
MNLFVRRWSSGKTIREAVFHSYVTSNIVSSGLFVAGEAFGWSWVRVLVFGV